MGVGVRTVLQVPTATARPGGAGLCGTGMGEIQPGNVSVHEQLQHPAPTQQSPEGTYRSPNIMGSLRHWVQASWNHCRQR